MAYRTRWPKPSPRLRILPRKREEDILSRGYTASESRFVGSTASQQNAAST